MPAADRNQSPRSLLAGGARTVVFDCDSTLAAIEGIDELAGDHAEEIRQLTDAAMDGSVPLQEVYGRRLAIIRPTADRLAEIGRLYVERLVPDARECVAALRWLGKDVRIISGGLLPAVMAVGHELGVPAARIAAVGIEFDDGGDYAGFDDASPLARNGGKPEVLRAWNLDRPAIMVGDGKTDLETCGEVDMFVAYMGVAQRPAVAAEADVVLSQPSLGPVLCLAASDEDRERIRSSVWADLFVRSARLLDDSFPATAG